MSQVLSWSNLSDSSISEVAVRQQHRPSDNFKFYSNSYEANQSVTIKASHAFRVYVLSGSCSLVGNGKELELDAEHYVQLTEGSYTCNTGSEGLSMVKVFNAAAKK